MSKRRFNLEKRIESSEKDETLKTQLNIIENQANFNFQLITWERMRPSDKNQFEKYKIGKPDKYNEIKESIRTYGLLHNIIIIPIDDDTAAYEFEILAGEHRHSMIGELIEEGDTKFLKGIPCRILARDTTIVDQKIIVEISNVMEGHNDPSEVRKSVERLTLLYETKNLENNTNTSVVKQIAENLDLNERQVQRYRTINDNLIPELQEALDKKLITIERASNIANQDEISQKLIFDLLTEKIDNNEKISKTEIEIAKNEANRRTEEVKKLQLLLEKNEKEIESLNTELQTSQEKNEAIQKQMVETQVTLQAKEDLELQLRNEIEAELEKNNPDVEIIDNLEHQLSSIEMEKEKISHEKEKMEKELTIKEKEVQKLQNKVKELEHNNNTRQPEPAKLTKEEQLQLSDSYQITILLTDLIKRYNLLETELEKYKKNYKEVPKDINDIFKKLENISTQVITKI